MKTARFLIKKEIKEVLNKLNLVLEDFQLLRDGKWVPDKKSCNDSIHNIKRIINIIDDE
jgi:hypothetical protein|tara:strand:- start:3922 stop:4098 length:177 start_codon:yes stop_codon:yes gene_type:complete